MDNIELLLRECGAELAHITTCHVYLTDIRYREPVYQVLGRADGGRVPGLHRPRRAGAGAAGVGGRGDGDGGDPVTFSLAGRCARTGMFGAVVSSSSPAVAARCTFARAGVGAACSQNVTDPRLGRQLLDFAGGGEEMRTPRCRPWSRRRRTSSYRQLTVVDARGRVAAYSGAGTLGTFAAHVGRQCVAAGNLLATPDVPPAMAAAFEQHPEADLGDRLVAALQAGLAAGGEEGPVRSCGMVMVRDVDWYVADLRVDWSRTTRSRELARVWEVYKPQLDDYVTRALDPTAAPSYGVPGNE